MNPFGTRPIPRIKPVMPPPLSLDQIDRLARKRAGAKLGWYVHAAVYVCVNAGLFLVSSHALGDRRWPLFPLFGWGLGLLLHGVSVFVLGAGGGLRERMVEKERERLLRQHKPLPHERDGT